eukprot:TRINITY_DN4864_c0_g1_i1.p1 TRINITY_DN4864_c0_g1~~TRINITY_DN4864_c0_g1_i1.p1  ORF type:complete len:164 (-),score=22.80 TRINITY_DN4864_c0_g1_i1:27-518(-)
MLTPIRIKVKVRGSTNTRARFFEIQPNLTLSENLEFIKSSLGITNKDNFILSSEDGTPYQSVSHFRQDDVVFLEEVEDQKELAEIRSIILANDASMKPEEDKKWRIYVEDFVTEEKILLKSFDSFHHMIEWMDNNPTDCHHRYSISRPKEGSSCRRNCHEKTE